MSSYKSDSSARWLLFGIGVVLCVIFLPSMLHKDYKNEYEALQEKYYNLHEYYDELQSKYEELVAECDTLESENSSLQDENMKLSSFYESVGNLEDDSATLFCFFDEEEDITFSEAKKAYENIEKFFASILYP